ncbi:hypothetical protein FRC19_005834 [Serendipita sp. 401]|nr:hypothetical protein FRC19_005834 [Serendipita sp. 401]
MVRNNNLVEAHQWDSSSQSWQKIGEVVDAVGSGRKQLFDGKEYDYVFDVDIKDGAPPLKLPYNANENPYQAAHRFLTRNDLPMSYIDEVAQFIDKNTAPVRLGTSNEQYVDPFTGASRYIPRGNTGGTGSTAPTTYGSGPVGSSNVDPFTGSARGSGKAKVLPVLSPLPFKQANVAAMEKKIQELNETTKTTDASAALQPEEGALFTEIFGAISTNNTSSLSAQHITTIATVIQRWPTTQVFPVIDLLRLVLGSNPAAFKGVKDKEAVIASLFRAAERDQPWDNPLSKPRETNLLLVTRSIANMFQAQSGLVPASWTSTVFAELSAIPSTVWTKNTLLALSTLLLNYSCVIHRSQTAAQDQDKHLGLIETALGNANSDQETLYRGLVAFGNVVSETFVPD